MDAGALDELLHERHEVGVEQLQVGDVHVHDEAGMRFRPALALRERLLQHPAAHLADEPVRLQHGNELHRRELAVLLGIPT